MAAGEVGVGIGYIPSGADHTANQYCAVNLDGGAGWVLSGAGEYGYILQNAPTAAGERADVIAEGVSWAKAGAAFAIGARLTPQVGTGRLITAANATDHVVARALEAAGANGDEVRVMVHCEGLRG